MNNKAKRMIMNMGLCAGVILSGILGVLVVKSGNSAEIVKYEPLKAPHRGNTDGFDLNTASKEMLMSIKGIGEVYSQNIIDKREEMGGYVYVDDLLCADGIGIKRLEAIKPYVKTK